MSSVDAIGYKNESSAGFGFKTAMRTITGLIYEKPQTYFQKIRDRLEKALQTGDVNAFVQIALNSEGEFAAFNIMLNQVFKNGIANGHAENFVRIFTAIGKDALLEAIDTARIEEAVTVLFGQKKKMLFALEAAVVSVCDPAMQRTFTSVYAHTYERLVNARKASNLQKGMMRLVVYNRGRSSTRLPRANPLLQIVR